MTKRKAAVPEIDPRTEVTITFTSWEWTCLRGSIQNALTNAKKPKKHRLSEWAMAMADSKEVFNRLEVTYEKKGEDFLVTLTYEEWFGLIRPMALTPKKTETPTQKFAFLMLYDRLQIAKGLADKQGEELSRLVQDASRHLEVTRQRKDAFRTDSVQIHTSTRSD
jgi:hypothetical protein